MDNKLLDYDIEELLLAATRKAVILRLAATGSPIDQDKVDTLSTEVNKEYVLYEALSKTATKVISKYREE